MPSPELIAKLRTAYQQWHDTRGASTAALLELMAEDVQLRSIADGVEKMEFSAPRSGSRGANSDL